MLYKDHDNQSHNPHVWPIETDPKLSQFRRWHLRVIVANCNSVASKSAELANVVDYTEPDILLLTETKWDNRVLSFYHMATLVHLDLIGADRVAGLW